MLLSQEGKPVFLLIAYSWRSIVTSCALRGDNSRKLGWEPQYDVKHLMSHVDEEVDFILKHDVK